MRKLFQRLIEWLLYFGEDPNDTMAHYNRRWRYWPSISWWRGRVIIGIDTQIVQRDGKSHEPYTVGSQSIEVIIDPRRWKIGYDHTYYDGPHHRTQLLMFAYYTDYAWDCKGCCGDRL